MLGAVRTAALASLVTLLSGVAACGAAAPASKSPESANTARPTQPADAAKAKASLADQLAQLVDSASRPVAIVVLPLAADDTFLVQEKDMRAERQSFRPGSTVKPLLAMVAADDGVLLPNAQHACSGAKSGTGLTCFAEHGDLDVVRAIATSCNVYFYDVAGDLGLARVLGGFRELGFGKPTGLAANEATGFVGDEVGFARASGTSSDPVLDAQVIGIGHGAFEATPLQLAVAYRTLARRIAAERDQKTPRAEVYAEIERGLEAAVASDEGTGRGARVAGLDVVGKTGTAEAHPYGAADEGRQNGWFVGYAPKRDPKLVVVAVVQNAEAGGKDAAALAGRVFAAWHESQKAH